MRSEKAIKAKIQQMWAQSKNDFENKYGVRTSFKFSSKFLSSRMHGKINALEWVLGNISEL